MALGRAIATTNTTGKPQRLLQTSQGPIYVIAKEEHIRCVLPHRNSA